MTHTETRAVLQSAEEGAPERNIRLTGQQVGKWFIAKYIAALIGVYLALVTPASVTIALRVGQIDPEGKAGSFALVSAVGAGAALISNPIFGALSDRSTSRWGQRRPFLIVGFTCGALALLAIGFAPSILWVAVGWAAAQCAFNAALAAIMSVLPERVPVALRGRVSGFMGMTGQMGVVGGTFLIQLVGTSGASMFIWPTLVGALMVLPFALTLREVPKARGERVRETARTVLSSFWINPLKHPDFGFAWFGRFFAWIALYLLTTYKTYFLIDHLGYTTATVAPVLTLAMFVLALAIAVSSIGGGWLSDRIGRRKPFVIAASLLFVIAMVIVAMSSTVEMFLVGMVIAGLGNGLYLGVDLALIAEVLPDSGTAAGKGMGVFNLSSTIPQTVAPVLAPALLLINADGKSGNYTSLYLIAAGLAFAGAVLIQFIRGTR
ncbi:Major Facilitator Superfamily protein [Arthrobacter sp. yr096]|uniref:MFS transporter n=1 Tax=unclassified Arthrobacter TaxID=235627 RepID=UPI000896BC76|nr:MULTISPECIES: MFS transporter [unclassified Arthrobacter]SDW88821.1 Major Facilitator Superfamily protein [Arthrobacter sp. cf158]SEI95497.1 Major Facilitator Superfamily protein [Arthrobacter sp. yr096]